MDATKNIWAKADLEGLIQCFVSTTRAAMAIADVNGRILWCNERLADIYEEPRSEIVGSYFGDRVIYPQGVDVGARIGQAIERGYTELIKTRWMTKAGAEKFMHQRIYRLDDKEGNHIGFWGIAYEFTQEKKTIKESRAAVKVLTEMQAEEIQERQQEVIEMIKAQSEALCPGKDLRGEYCPAVLAVEETITKDRPAIQTLLTGTELEVAAYVKAGMSIKKIADKMCISERTVKNHRLAIRKKLKITHTNISLAKYLQGFPI